MSELVEFICGLAALALFVYFMTVTKRTVSGSRLQQIFGNEIGVVLLVIVAVIGLGLLIDSLIGLL